MEKYGTAKRIEQKKIDVHYTLCWGGQGWGLNFPLSVPFSPSSLPFLCGSHLLMLQLVSFFSWFLPPWEFYFPLFLIPPPVEFSSPCPWFPHPVPSLVWSVSKCITQYTLCSLYVYSRWLRTYSSCC